MRPLTLLLFDDDILIQWRAVEALGKVAGLVSEKDMERVRRQIRRLLWLMNDESGGICWRAPEAIGEILFNVPDLIEEFGQLLPSFFVEEPFETGSRWAVARIAALKPAMYESAADALSVSLGDPNPTVRGYSLLALQAIGRYPLPDKVKALRGDQSIISVYDYRKGELSKISIGQLLRQ